MAMTKFIHEMQVIVSLPVSFLFGIYDAKTHKSGSSLEAHISGFLSGRV